MKRFLVWLLGVVLGVVLFLAAAVGYSWVSTGPAKLPDDEGIAFGGVALEQNGYCWQVPLIGAMADKVFYSSPNLTVQKLGTVAEAWPDVTMPGWADPWNVFLTIENTDTDTQVFAGTLEQYWDFRYAENGSYQVVMEVWRLPEGMAKADMAQPTDKVVKSPGLEQPARAAGWYSYRFNFMLSASPEVTLSADTIRQGDALAIIVSGMLGEEAPTAKTDLGSVQFNANGAYWIGYVGAAYNADAGSHTIAVTLGEHVVETAVKVKERTFGMGEAIPEPEPPAGAGEQFRNAIWALYEAKSGPRQWTAASWLCPVGYEELLLSYGMVKTVDGVPGAKSNSTVFATTPGMGVYAPAAGTVAFAGDLLLTGKTVVVDHGCGVRTYLYGLSEITVSKGDAVTVSDAVGKTSEMLTMDIKIGSKSIDPWELFNGRGALFVFEP